MKKDYSKDSERGLKITVTSNKLSEQGLKNLAFAIDKFVETVEDKYNISQK